MSLEYAEAIMQGPGGFAKAFTLDSNRNGMLSEFW